MNSTLKSVAVGVGAVAVLVFAYAAVSYVNSYGKSIQPSSFRSFSVTAEGKTVSIPDVAAFSFTVITEGGTDLAALQTRNTESMNNAIDFVKGQGVDAKDIKTSYYNVNPRYENYSCYDAPVNVPNPERATVSSGSSSGSSPSGVATPSTPSVAPVKMVKTCPPPAIVGYTITQSVGVKIRDFKKISGIMSGVVTNGANKVGSLSFTTDDPTAVQDTARAQAIAKAKVKAEAMAKAGGFKIGRLLGITDGGYSPYSSYRSYDSSMGLSAEAKAVSAPAIEPGSQETTVNVTLQYEIQ
jgi:uncharacterized protein